jgi:2-methylcitrate dehydratase PrpD
VVAAALMEGQALPPQFSEAKMSDPVLVELARRIRCEHDPALDQLYPARFAAWVAAQDKGEWVRVDVMDPLGSTANPVDASGVAEKFRGINPRLDTEAIAAAALNVESHSVGELLGLLAGRRAKQLQTA